MTNSIAATNKFLSSFNQNVLTVKLNQKGSILKEESRKGFLKWNRKQTNKALKIQCNCSTLIKKIACFPHQSILLYLSKRTNFSQNQRAGGSDGMSGRRQPGSLQRVQEAHHRSRPAGNLTNLTLYNLF